MKILLTGANGFFGTIIKNELFDGNNIITLSRTNSDYEILLDAEIPSFNEIFDLVIHAAGKAHSVPKTEIEKRNFHDVNVLGTLNLLKGLEKIKLPKEFVFVSSVAVYGQEIGTEIDENYSLKAIDPYGLSKIEAENIILNWCERNNIICTILRLPLLVGKNPPGNLGAMIRAIEKGYYFNIDGGKARKSMVLAKDVASLIKSASSIGGTYNITDGFNPSFNELSLAISKNRNKKPPFNLPKNLAISIGKIGDFLGSKAPLNSSKLRKITFDLTFDDSKARKILNWNPQSVVNFINNNKI